MTVDAGKTFENVLGRCENACFCQGKFPEDNARICFKDSVDELFLDFLNTYSWVEVASIDQPSKFANTDEWYVVVEVSYTQSEFLS